MAKTLSKLIKSQVGKGGKKYWRYAGFASRVEWCGAFVWWCLHHCSEKFEYMKGARQREGTSSPSTGTVTAPETISDSSGAETRLVPSPPSRATQAVAQVV